MLSTGILICCTGPFWKGSLCLFGFCLPVSSVPNFRPDTGGWRWSLVQVASSIMLGEGRALLSPSAVLRLPDALYGAGPASRAVPVFGCSTKALTRLRLRFVPSPPEQLRQPGAWRAHSPRMRCAFSPPRSQPQSPPARSGVGARCLATTLPADVDHENLRRSLVRNWSPVCSVVGDAVLGAEPAPFPYPLPPASFWAGLVRSRLAPLDLLRPFVLWTAGSVFGLVNFLSLFRCSTF